MNTFQEGQYPIDSIFMSEDINIIAGGYRPIEEAPLDYRAIWIKLNIIEVLGYKPHYKIPTSIRRV